MVTIDHLVGTIAVHCVDMKVTEKEALAVRCPTCGAKPGEKCELSTGLPRTEPHRDRRLAGFGEVNRADTFSRRRAVRPLN
jgi:hypothetical protein